jgi:hypothetical protein
MAALGAVILGLACLFYGYCLVHFGRELMRSRNKLTCYGLSRPNSGGAVVLGMPSKVVSMRASQVATARGRVDSQFAAVEPSAYANIILTLGKSRLTVLPSRAARLAQKRAAKGSS